MRSSKPLYLVLAAYVAAGVWHYAGGPDLAVDMPLPDRYDESRNAREDIITAVKLAKKENKRVLIQVGGDWCSWCDTLDAFMKENADVKSLEDKYFVTVKVAVPQANPHNPALAGLPAAPGYPHFYVLDEKGALVVSKDTEELEGGSSYSRDKMIAFLYDFGRPLEQASAGYH